MTESHEQDRVYAPQGRPKLFGPRRRYWWLALWGGLLLAVLVVQRATAHSFERIDLMPDGTAVTTDAEVLWVQLPLVAIVVVAAAFLVGLGWLVPEKGSRGVIRAWGFLLSFLSLVASFVMSVWFGIFDLHIE